MHIQARVHTNSRTVKGSLALGDRVSAKDWTWTRELIASQAGQLQSGAREAPPCLQRSKASLSKALFTFCSLQQLNCTRKSPFSVRTLFLLFTLSDLAAFWQLIQFLCTEGNYVLNWIIGSFHQMSAHPPTQPQIQNIPLGWAARYKSLLDRHVMGTWECVCVNLLVIKIIMNVLSYTSSWMFLFVVYLITDHLSKQWTSSYFISLFLSYTENNLAKEKGGLTVRHHL